MLTDVIVPSWMFVILIMLSTPVAILLLTAIVVKIVDLVGKLLRKIFKYLEKRSEDKEWNLMKKWAIKN